MKTNDELENEIHYLRGRIEFYQNDKRLDQEKKTQKMLDNCILENRELKIKIAELEKN